MNERPDTEGTETDVREEEGATAVQAPSIRLAAARIEDFRVLEDVHVTFERRLTLIVGENNAGKSALLLAIDRALRRTRSGADDLRVDADGNRAERFVVDLRFEPADDEGFSQQVRDILGPALRPPAPPGLPSEFAALRTVATAGSGGDLGYRKRFLQGWGESRDEAAHVTELANVPVEPDFFRLFEYSLLDASRDLEQELHQRTSAWGQLLANLEIPLEVQEELEAALARVGTDVIANSPVLQGLRGTLDQLRTAMPAGVGTVDVAPLPPRAEELGRQVDVVISAPDEAALALRHQGSGGRSLTSLLAFRAFVEARLGAGQLIKPLAISALEEPEAHLHPHAQKVALDQVAAIPGQHIVTTHSPSVGVAAQVEAIRRLSRHAGTASVHALDRDKTPWERLHFKRWLLRRNAEALFARLVILVEGETDESALPPLAAVHWAPADPSGHGISVLDATGSMNVANVASALQDLKIPWIALFDGDQGGTQGLNQLREKLSLSPVEEEARVVVLPQDVDFERYLINEGFRTPVLRAYDQLLRPGAVQPGISDDELVTRMRNTKGSFGAIMAAEIAQEIDQDPQRLPAKLQDLFQLARDRLGGNP